MIEGMFHQVADAWLTRLRATPHPDAGLLFPEADDVQGGGQVVNAIDTPAALVSFGDADAREQETTTKVRNDLPVRVKLIFARDSGSAAAAGEGDLMTGVRQVQDEVFQAVYKQIMGSEAGRTLDGVAITTEYFGGGQRLTIEDIEGTEGDPDRFSITLEFQTTYRHRVDDPTVQA